MLEPRWAGTMAASTSHVAAFGERISVVEACEVIYGACSSCGTAGAGSSSITPVRIFEFFDCVRQLSGISPG